MSLTILTKKSTANISNEAIDFLQYPSKSKANLKHQNKTTSAVNRYNYRVPTVIWNLCFMTWLFTFLSLLVIVIMPRRSSMLNLLNPFNITNHDNNSYGTDLISDIGSTTSNRSSSTLYNKQQPNKSLLKNHQPNQEPFVAVAGEDGSSSVAHSYCNNSKICSLINKHSICLNGTCKCLDTSNNINSTCIHVTRASNFHPEHMLPIMIVLAVMFIGICIAMNMFSRARFRNQRNAFIAGRVPKRHRSSLPNSASRLDQQRYQSGAKSISLGPTPTPSPQPQLC